MRSILTLIILLAGICPPLSAGAAMPPLRPLDVTTIFLMHETARSMARDLRPLAPDRERLKIKRIVIDPGHGGSNQGAVGVANIREKRLTIELAYAVRAAVEARYPDVEVLMTRYWDRDVGLSKRIQWANAMGADLFLSLHYNAATHDRAIGYETYFLAEETMAATAEPGSRRGQDATPIQKRAFRGTDKSRVKAHTAARQLLVPAHERSRALADIVQRALIDSFQSTSVNRGVKEANFAVLRGAKMPAVVVESGFLTHPEEGVAVLVDTHRQVIVTALVAAIAAFDKTLPSKPAAKPAAPVATK